MASDRFFTFAGGDSGSWRVVDMRPVVGEPLATVARLNVTQGATHAANAGWLLRGVTSNVRYTTQQEKAQLEAKQVAIGSRAEATSAALIPIRKNAAWWALPQDERRRILEESSHHIQIGLEYLPAIARRLHHCRDLGDNAPFDFLTWFDYAPADSAAFEELVAKLRATEEWKYVDRECDIRVERA